MGMHGVADRIEKWLEISPDQSLIMLEMAQAQ